LPKELQVSFRLPAGTTLAGVTVNGRAVSSSGAHNDAALVVTDGQRTFEVVAQLG